VRDLRRRSDHDARTGDLGAPTEVEVFAQRGDQWVEATQRGEEVASNERDTTRCDEDVALQVLLTVVDLPWFHALVHDAESVAGLSTCSNTIGSS